MRGPLVLLFSGLIITGAMVAGCGGGGGSALPNAPRSTQSNTLVQVRIVIPQRSAQGRRIPKFVSPSTQSAIVEIIGPVPSTTPAAGSTAPPGFVAGSGYANLNSSSCTAVSSGLSCAISAPVNISTAGEYEILVFTLDKPQTSSACIPTPSLSSSPAPPPSPCAGTVLGLNFVQAQITPGQTNPVKITLGGIPVFLQPVELVSGLVGGKGSALYVFGKSQAKVSFRLLDADQNIIASSIDLQVTGNNGLVAPSISQTPDSTGLYILSITPTTTSVGGQIVAATGQTSLSITPSVATGLGGVGPPITLPITVMHSVIYVANGANQVDAYLDGNTTPAFQDYTSGSGGSFVGIAVNPIDESLWIADSSNNDVVTFAMGTPGTNPPIATTFCGNGGNAVGCSPSTVASWENATHIAFDSSGNAYLSTYNGSAYQIQAFDAPAPGATPDLAGSPAFTYNSPNSYAFCHLALDDSGHIYAGNMLPTFVNFNKGVSAANTFVNGANIDGVAWAPDGTLWYLNSASPGQAFNVAASAPTVNQKTIASIPASGLYESIAVDQLGNLYVAGGSGTGVTEYAAPNFATPTTIGTTVSPQYVAVFPDGLFGSQAPIGVPQPSQSPIPVASPIQI